MARAATKHGIEPRSISFKGTYAERGSCELETAEIYFASRASISWRKVESS